MSFRIRVAGGLRRSLVYVVTAALLLQLLPTQALAEATNGSGGAQEDIEVSDESVSVDSADYQTESDSEDCVEVSEGEESADAGQRADAVQTSTDGQNDSVESRPFEADEFLLGTQSESISDPRVVADSSMDSRQVTTWDCIWLGSYPQSYVNDAETVEALDEATGWDDNGDLLYDGVTYRRLNQSGAVNSQTSSGYWSWGSKASPAGWCYFRWEPIKWRVLETDGTTAIAMADVALDNQQYHPTHTRVTWETCALRAWIDSTFREAAFNSAQQSALKKRTLVNGAGTYNGTSGGNNTEDDIFLLSEAEVWGTSESTRHGFASGKTATDEARRCKPSDYAHAMGTFYQDYYGKLSCKWWLRSPGDWNAEAVNVLDGGKVNPSGYGVHELMNAVRPAISIDLSSDRVFYAGTVSSKGDVDETSAPETEIGPYGDGSHGEGTDVGSDPEKETYLPSRNALNLIANYGIADWTLNGNSIDKSIFERVMSPSRQADWLQWYEEQREGATKGLCHGYSLVSVLTYNGMCPIDDWQVQATDRLKQWIELSCDEDNSYEDVQNDFMETFADAIAKGHLGDIPQAVDANAGIQCMLANMNLRDFVVAAYVTQYLPVVYDFQTVSPEELLAAASDAIANDNPILINLGWATERPKWGKVKDLTGHTVVPYAINTTAEGAELFVYNCNWGNREGRSISFVKDKRGKLQWELDWDDRDPKSSEKGSYAYIESYDTIGREWEAISCRPYPIRERALFINQGASLRNGDKVLLGDNTDNYYSFADSGVRPVLVSGDSPESKDSGSDLMMLWVEEGSATGLSVNSDEDDVPSRAIFVNEDMSVDLSSDGPAAYTLNETPDGVLTTITPAGESAITVRYESDTNGKMALGVDTNSSVVVSTSKDALDVQGVSQLTMQHGEGNSNLIAFNQLDESERYTLKADASGIELSDSHGQPVAPVISLHEPGADISPANVTISNQTYTGKPLEPTVTVTLGEATLVAGTDYTVRYANNVNVGTATVVVTGTGNYGGTIQAHFSILAPEVPARPSTRPVTRKDEEVIARPSTRPVAKADNGMVVDVTAGEVLFSRVKKKAQRTVAFVRTSGASGEVSITKVGGHACLSVSPDGRFTVKKGTKKGTYRASVRVTAAGDANHEPATRDVEVVVKVVSKLTNPMLLTSKTAIVKASKVRKKNQTLKTKRLVAVKGAKGKVTYKKASGNKKISVASNGTVTVKKGLKPGTYKVKVKVTAAGNKSYKKATRTVTCTVVVK